MKKLFAVIGTFFSKLFSGVEDFVTKHVTPSVQVITLLRNALKGNVAEIAVNLIPGNWDNAAREFLIRTLSKAIDAAQVSTDILNEQTDFGKIVKLLEYLRTLSDPMKKAVLFKLASEYTKVSAKDAGATVPKGSIVDSLVQLEFTKQKHETTFNTLEEGKAELEPAPAKRGRPATK